MNCSFCKQNEPTFQFLGGESCCKKCYMKMERKIEDFLDSTNESKSIKEITNLLLNGWDIPFQLAFDAVEVIVEEKCRIVKIIRVFYPDLTVEYKNLPR